MVGASLLPGPLPQLFDSLIQAVLLTQGGEVAHKHQLSETALIKAGLHHKTLVINSLVLFFWFLACTLVVLPLAPPLITTGVKLSQQATSLHLHTALIQTFPCRHIPTHYKRNAFSRALLTNFEKEQRNS